MRLCQGCIDFQGARQNQCPLETHHIKDQTCHFDKPRGEAVTGPRRSGILEPSTAFQFFDTKLWRSKRETCDRAVQQPASSEGI